MKKTDPIQAVIEEALSRPFDEAEFARTEAREDRRRRRRRLFWLGAFVLAVGAFYYVVLSSWLRG